MMNRLSSIIIRKTLFNPTFHLHRLSTTNRISTKKGDDEWNDAWESAWLPEDLSSRAPWETDVNHSITTTTNNNMVVNDVDAETMAFVEDMADNWDQRRRITRKSCNNNNNSQQKEDEEEKKKKDGDSSSALLYKLNNLKRDYRLKKQRIHAGLWVKEIEKQQEAKFSSDGAGDDDDIDRLLHSCSEIFDSNNDLNNLKTPCSTEFKNKPDGWETTEKAQDGNVWEMSQREEDILLQEFERRIAFSKFQIASFIKTHIFSRRRPIDGWKYMIEEIGPNAKRGKGSVSRLPSLSDASTQPFKEEKMTPIASSVNFYQER